MTVTVTFSYPVGQFVLEETGITQPDVYKSVRNLDKRFHTLHMPVLCLLSYLV